MATKSLYDTKGVYAINSATKLAAVTPSDATIVGCRGLWVGVAGNVAVIAVGDTVAVTLVGVSAGQLLPIACSKVMSTNTTATSIVALF